MRKEWQKSAGRGKPAADAGKARESPAPWTKPSAASASAAPLSGAGRVEEFET